MQSSGLLELKAILHTLSSHPPCVRIQEHVSEMGVTALLSTHTKFPSVSVHKWACVCGMESEWKCEAGKSLCCLFIFSFQNLGAAFSSTFKVGTAWKHGACCICAHSAALYYFLWTTTTANHHGKQPLTAVCTLSPCSIWWKAQGPGCFFEKHRNRQMVIFVTWMMLGGGGWYSGQEIWALRFLPHWLRGTFPHSLTISLLASSTS